MVTLRSNKSYAIATTLLTPLEGCSEPDLGGAAHGDTGDEDHSADDSPPEKKFRDFILGEIWLEIDEEIASNAGSSYGVITKTLKKHQQKFKWLTRDHLNYYRKQATKEFKLPPHQIDVPSSTSQAVSLVTFNEELENGARVNVEEEQTEPPLENQSSVSSNAAEGSDDSRNLGGRPKGTTNEAIRDLKFRRSAALNWAAVEFNKAKEAKDGTKWGKQKEIVREANTKFGLPEKDWISKETVRSRLKPARKLEVAHSGLVSPMIRLEGYFVDIFLSLGAMRQPSNSTQGLQIINSMIKGTCTENQIKEWKKSNLKIDCTGDDDGPLLGQKYWANFLKRHPQLTTKHCVRFDSQREAWAR
jgi:hypothetical protein